MNESRKTILLKEMQDACASGAIDVIENVLNHSDFSLEEKRQNCDYVLRRCSFHGHLDVIKFLMTNFKEHVDIHNYADQSIIWACEKERFEVIKYFAFDLSFQLPSSLKSRLENDMAVDVYEKVLNIF